MRSDAFRKQNLSNMIKSLKAAAAQLLFRFNGNLLRSTTEVSSFRSYPSGFRFRYTIFPCGKSLEY